MTMRSGTVFFSDRPAGRISETESGYEFRYFPEYIALPQAQAVSFSFPLRAEAWTSSSFFPFFDGLIPEGWLLDIGVKNWKIDPADRMGLLLAFCADCVGAVGVRTDPDEGKPDA
jgi:serine/threonine-protein kinase HipA